MNHAKPRHATDFFNTLLGVEKPAGAIGAPINNAASAASMSYLDRI